MDRYEEALAKARTEYEKAREQGYTWLMNLLEGMFPDLKESEDERIRQAIIAVVQWAECFNASSVTHEDAETMLAWLEKQKAKERLDRMAPIYNDKESFESALEKAWKYYNESASRTVDSFEDDYIECVFSKGFREGFLYKEKQKEQKPAEWSEEDSRILYNVIAYIGYAAGQRGVRDDEFKEANTWLKSLPNGFIVNQNYNEDMVNLLVTELQSIAEHNDAPRQYDVEISWLKSLRPQPKCQGTYNRVVHTIFEMLKGKDFYGIPTSSCVSLLNDIRVKCKDAIECAPILDEPSWKPSEEQMEWLKSAVRLSADKPTIHGTIISLYEQLKRL